MSFPSPADDYSENRLRLDDLIVHREATFFVRHSGLTMEPTIHDGDALIVDRTLIPRDNQVVMVRLREKFMIRRIMAYDDGYTLLIADNPAFVIVPVFRSISVSSNPTSSATRIPVCKNNWRIA